MTIEDWGCSKVWRQSAIPDDDGLLSFILSTWRRLVREQSEEVEGENITVTISRRDRSMDIELNAINVVLVILSLAQYRMLG